MAFMQIKEGGRYVAAQREFVCDTTSDLDTILSDYADDLPIGAIATVVEAGDVYILDSTGEWQQQPSGGGGGGGGGDYDIATNSEVEAMLTRIFG